MRKRLKYSLYDWRKMYRWKFIDSKKGKTLGFSKKIPVGGFIELDLSKIPPGLTVIDYIDLAERSGIIYKLEKKIYEKNYKKNH